MAILKKSATSFLLILFCVILSACQPAALSSTPTPTQPPAPTETAYPTATKTQAPTATSAPTKEPTQIPPSPTPACTLREGAVTLASFESETLQTLFHLRVYTPPCYGYDPSQRYPVLYLLHGLGADDAQWQELGVTEAADRMINQGEATPFIIVMPYEPKYTAQEPLIYPTIITGELVPWVDAQYQTLVGSRFRAIGGLSRGAAWALRIGASNWEQFGAIGLHSLPSLADEGQLSFQKLLKIPKDEFPRLFLDIGDRDRERQFALAFEADLAEANIPHTWYLFKGEHTRSYWQEHLPIYLEWYTQDW